VTRYLALARRIVLRLLQAILVVFIIATANFALVHLVPGDAADVLAGESGSATPEYMEMLRRRFGLDKPLPEQYALYIWNTAHLDLGYSFRFSEPVAKLIGGRLPATLLLMLPAAVLSFLVGVGMGVFASRRVGTFADRAVSVVSVIVYAMPVFWVGLMMIVVFSVKLRWLPTNGMETIASGYQGLEYIFDVIHHMILPVAAMALFYIALYTRMMRASMLEVSTLDFVTTARAKGLNDSRVAYGHVLPNALLPMVTLLGLQISTLLGGSILIETIFGWPGIGRLAYDSIAGRDVNLLMGILLASSIVVIVTNMVVDLAYGWLDPRISRG
jgi:peptide/nickel transport system permease protein